MADEATTTGVETTTTDNVADDKTTTTADTGAETTTTDGVDKTDGTTSSTTDGKTDDKGDTGETDKAGAMPDNWRDLAADGDEDTLKLLKRYGSVKGVARALREANDKIRTGKTSVSDEAMPDPEKEPDKAKAWRKERGIPDDPSGYVLPETVTKRMTDADKPMVSSFTEFAHSKNASPAAVEIATEWYVEMAEQAEAQRIAGDKEAGSDTEEALRKDWGWEYKGNINLAHRWVESIPGVGTDLAVIRTPDGRRLVDNPDFVAWASDMGRSTFGDPVFADTESEAKHNNRKAEIEGIMKTDMNRYYAEGLDKELLEINQREQKRRA